MEHSYKMKQVCEKTGLTEKAVRLYVSEGLVQPEVTRTLHGLLGIVLLVLTVWVWSGVSQLMFV